MMLYQDKRSLKMLVVFYYKGKKISKAKAVEIFGKEKLNKRIKEAQEEFKNDPNVLNEWADGLVIEFVYQVFN
jgi:hypothetical protein